MVIIKTADSQFTLHEIHEPQIALKDSMVRDRFFRKVADLKRVAPRASDFLYFSCIMMHAAEAALIDQKTGAVKTGNGGTPLTAEWVVNDKGSWKWSCSDPNIRPYKNNNGDIFPESELKKAYKMWVERPLCKDHQSSSVDGVRGLVIDTYWDDKHKRVIALCALDKINYPDLARKVSTGYATNVSMGTAVGQSICFECGNVAKVEAEYCDCVRDKSTYGEINIDLSPIELSLVVTGADPGAKLRSIIASLNQYSQKKAEQVELLRTNGCVTPGEVDRLENEIRELKAQLHIAGAEVKNAGIDEESGVKIRNLMEVINSPNASREAKDAANRHLLSELAEEAPPADLASAEEAGVAAPGGQAPAAADGQTQSAVQVEPPYGVAGNLAMTGGRGRSYTEDPHSSGPVPHWSLDGRESRLASMGLGAQVLVVKDRLDSMEKTLRELSEGIQANASRTRTQEEQNMSTLRERARARRAMFDKKAYHQGGGGVNDPQTYPVDPLNDQLKTKGDKQMEGQGMEPGSDGLHPGYQSYGNELSLKQKLSRAQLEERRLRRQGILARGTGPEFKQVDVGDGQKLTLVKSQTGKWEQANESLAADIALALDQGVLDPANPLTSEAYHQGGGGVNDPQTYPVDPLNDKLKTDGDKQMEGQGMEPGSDGMHPGYQSYGNEEALKKKLLRAKLNAKFIKVYADDSREDVDKEASRWEFFANGKKILSATGDDIYGDRLDQYWDHLSSEAYGREALAHLRNEGLNKTAYLLTGKVVTAQPPMAPPAAPAGPPAGPESAPPMPPMEGGPEGDLEEPAGAEGTKDKVDEALAKLEKDLGDLKDILEEEGSAEGGKEDLPPVEEAAADDGALRERAADLVASLNDSGDELALLSDTLERKIEAGAGDSDETKELARIADESLAACAELRSEAALVITAAAKKDDKEDKDDKKDDKKEDKKDDKEDKKDKKLPPFLKGKDKDDKEEKDDKKDDKKDKKDDKDDKEEKKSEAELALEHLLKARAARRREIVRQAMGLGEGGGEEMLEEEAHDIALSDDLADDFAEDMAVDYDDDFAVDYDDDESGLISELLSELEDDEPADGDEPDDGDEPADGDEPDDSDLDLPDGDDDDEAFDGMLAADASKRRAWRERVAAELEKAAAGDYQLKLDPAADMDTDMVPAAHPQGGYTLQGLDTSPSEELDKVERIDEIKAKIMKAVESLPPVREAVERVGDLLKSGALKVADLSDEAKLKALAIDPEAAKYWTQYFGEGDPASKTFGQELTKEFAQKKAAADADLYKVKLARSYDLALTMQDKGVIPDDSGTLHKQVEEIMTFDNKAFESFKKSVARLTGASNVRTAGGKALEVGVQTEVGGGGHAASADDGTTLASQLPLLWS